MTTRADVVTCARTWIGTPFMHQQRIKGQAVDCAGLVIGVARELALVAADFDVNGYRPLPDGRTLSEACRRHMTPIEHEAMQPGDVIEVAFDGEPQHLAFLGDYLYGGLSIIHALSNIDRPRVVETRLMFTQAMRFVQAYALPGLED